MEHAIERGVVMAEGSEIDIYDLGLPTKSAHPLSLATSNEASTPGAESTSVDMDDELSLEDYFQRFVLEHQDAMSETELAHKLGISRKCLWERRQRFKLPRKKAGKRKQA
jgi:DNA-binding NtrC family response regulator